MPDLTNRQLKDKLKDLQEKIAASPSARNAFLKNPSGTLAKVGVPLPAERATALDGFVNKELNTPGAKVSGAAIRPVGARNDVEVVVSVGVKF